MERGNAAVVPTVEEVRAYVGESLFDDFFTELTQKEGAKPVMEFGRCSWEYGWNMKFKKSGKTFYKIYPKENCVTFLVVVVLMLSLAVMISLCHADMRLPGYLSWNVSCDGAAIRPYHGRA